MTYLSIVIAVVAAIVIRHTRIGMNLRAVGENPATADATGVRVNLYKYAATCIGGIISGLGGLHFVMQYASCGWNKDSVSQLGWLSVALVIFATWKPLLSIFGSTIFAMLNVLADWLPGISTRTQQLMELLPYAVTVLVLVITSIREKKENQPPAHLGLPYFREER